MVEVKAITNQEQLGAIKDEWDALLKKSQATVFQSFAWQYTWFKHYGKRKRLLTLLIYEKKKLIGIAPLFVSFGYLGLPLKIVSFLSIGPTDYGDFILASGKEEIALKAVLDYLTEYKKWDVLDWQQLRKNSRSLEVLEKLLAENHFTLKELVQDVSFAVELPGNWEQLLSSLSKKFRWNVEYYNRRLRRDYNFELEEVRQEKDLAKKMESFFNLHRRRWRDKKQPGLFFSKKYQAFHQDIAAEFLKEGWLKLCFLKLNNEVVASLYGFKHNQVFYYYLGGFDPAWGRFSVATVLTSQAMKEALEEKFVWFDFLRGEESYKLKWQAKPTQNIRLLIGKKGVRAGLIKTILAQENKLIKKAKEKLH